MTDKDKTITVNVHLQPGAKKNEITGFRGDVLYAKVTAVAEKGRANQALLELMADTFGVPRSAVAIVRGQRSRNKVVSIQGLTREDPLAGVWGCPYRGVLLNAQKSPNTGGYRGLKKD